MNKTGFVFFSLLCLAQIAHSQNGVWSDRYDHHIVNEALFTRDFTVSDKVKTLFVQRRKTYFWYKSNNLLETKGGQGGKLLHGKYAEYYLNKNLKTQGKFRRGRRVGKWKTWYPNGNLQSISHFLFGFKWRSQINYSDQRFLISIEKYWRGRLHGWQTEYEDNKVAQRVKYRFGKLIKVDSTQVTDSTMNAMPAQ